MYTQVSNNKSKNYNSILGSVLSSVWYFAKTLVTRPIVLLLASSALMVEGNKLGVYIDNVRRTHDNLETCPNDGSPYFSILTQLEQCPAQVAALPSTVKSLTSPGRKSKAAHCNQRKKPAISLVEVDEKYISSKRMTTLRNCIGLHFISS